MKNIKISITLLLIAALILSSVCTAFADANSTKFADINSSWAKQYIINVYNKGLMNGFSETQFRPSLSVTNYQALITIARMTKAKDKYDLAALAEKYKNNLANVSSYAKLEIAYCLEAGIITPQELSALNENTEATKQVVSRYLAKAMGANYDPNKAVVFLGFTDSEFIIKENKPYIKHLIDLGVLSSAGDAKGNFNPNSVVTRDVFAKMLDVASDKYINVIPVPPITPTTPPATTNPTPTTPVTPPVTETPNYTGTIDQIIIENSVIIVQVKDANNVISKKSFNVATDIKCIIDGASVDYYWKAKIGDKVSIYTNKDGKISKLIVDSKIKKLSGTIDSILMKDKLEVNIKFQNGETKTYYITDRTKVVKNNITTKYDYLKPEDKVTITTEYDNVTEINASSTTINNSGVIESIIYDRKALPKIVILDKDGNKKEYFIRRDIDPKYIIVAGQISRLSDLKPGMNVKVDLENNEIVKLVTVDTESGDKFDAAIKYVNIDWNIIVITQFDSAQQKDVERKVYVGNSAIADAKLQRLILQQLKAGDKITIFGIDEINQINASSIIVNN